MRLGDIDQQRRLTDEVSARLRDMRPWYSVLGRLQFAMLFPATLFVIAVILNSLSLLGKLRGTQAKPSTLSLTEGEAFALQIAMFGIPALLGYVLDRFREYLFPRVFFVIGKQAREFAKRESMARVIFVVIGLGILVNILSSMIWSSHGR